MRSLIDVIMVFGMQVSFHHSRAHSVNGPLETCPGAFHINGRSEVPLEGDGGGGFSSWSIDKDYVEAF